MKSRDSVNFDSFSCILELICFQNRCFFLMDCKIWVKFEQCFLLRFCARLEFFWLFAFAEAETLPFLNSYC